MKKALYFMLALLLLIAGALASLPWLISADEIKQALISQVQQKTGRQLQIQGAVSWSFYPTLGVAIEQVRLLNPSGFPEDATLAVARGRVGVALMPLFSRQIQIEQLELDQPQIHLYQQANGQTNIDDLLTQAATAPKPAAANTDPGKTTGESAPSAAADYQVRLAGIQIRDGTLSLTKLASQQSYTLNHLQLTTGVLSANQPLDIQLATDFALDKLQGHLATKARLHPGASAKEWSAKSWTLDLRLQPDAATTLQLTSQADLSLLLPGAGTQQQLRLSPWQWTLQLKSPSLQGQWQNQGNLSVDWGKGDPQLRLDDWQLTGSQQGPAVPPSLANIQAQGNWRYHAGQRQLSWQEAKGELGKLQFQGALEALLGTIPTIRFNVSSPKIDLAWLGATPEKSTAPEKSVMPGKGVAQPSTKSATGEPSSTQEPDLRGLSALNAEGRVAVGRVMGPRLEMTDSKLAIQLQDGVLKVTDFSAGMYQGVVALTGQLDGRRVPAHLQLEPKIRAVQIQPLLKEWTGKEPVSGAATIQGKLAMLGLLPQNMRSSVAGDLNLMIQNGAVNGINLAAMLRDAKAALKGQSASGAVRKTDFSALTADVHLGQAKASSQNITLMSPLLRVKGRGNTHLLQESLDFHFDVSVVGTSKGQGGQDLADLRHLTIPLQIGGSWSKPDYALDMQSLFKQDLQRQIQEQIPQKLPGKLGQLFN